MNLFESKNIAPMLIAENRPAFNSPDWLFELKLDGIRCIAYLDKTDTVLRNKRNKDVTAIYPELSEIYKQAKKRCILDGEIFAMQNGKPDFFEMQRRSLMSNAFKIKLAAEKLPVSFVAFDILYLDSRQLTDLPLTERKVLLKKNVTDSERLSVSRTIDEYGVKLYEAAAAQGLEGIVAKRKDSKYYFDKRTKAWIKCKNLLDDDFVVCGYYFREGNLISIVLGQYINGVLAYQSHVVMGVSRDDFRKISSISSVPKEVLYPEFPDIAEAKWLNPEIVCTVKFMERTPGGGLRQPVFKGLRDDKSPNECVYYG